MTGKEDLDEELGEDEYFGFGVDAGMGCVADIQTQAAFKTTGPSVWKKTRTSTPTTICSAIFWRKTPKPPQISGGLRRLAQLDGAGHGLQPAHLCLWLGGRLLSRLLRYDAKGEVCAVYVRFIDIEDSYKEQE